MKILKPVCCAVLLMLVAGDAQSGMMIVPIQTKVAAVDDMTCPPGEYVYGFASGVPLCTDWSPRVVFVTSSTLTGAIGGLAAADVICQNEAHTAGLSGTYIAFLSNSVQPGSTIQWITNTNMSAAKYVRPDGTVIANTTADFLSASHLSPINKMANGTTVTGDDRVWTGYINDNGTIISQTNPQTTCSSWTDATPWTAGGSNGIASKTDTSWFNDYGTYCTEYHHLYCVQVRAGINR
jgi:hypothetical protein